MLATFMPKPFTHLTGNGLHMHLSLWDGEDDDELFADPTTGVASACRPSGTPSSAGCSSTPRPWPRWPARR